jgi:hypothetical protein
MAEGNGVDAERLPQIIRDIYRCVADLEAMFPGRHFTPDGHMVGSIGEALAAHYYGFDELFVASNRSHDGRVGERLVQVKATQKKRIAISSEPQHLLVFRLHKEGSFDEIYNGPGCRVWALVSGKKLPKNGQHPVSVPALMRLMLDVPESLRLPRVRA